MITKKHNQTRAWTRKLMVIPLLLALVFSFSERTTAQTSKEAGKILPPAPERMKQIKTNFDSLSPELKTFTQYVKDYMALDPTKVSKKELKDAYEKIKTSHKIAKKKMKESKNVSKLMPPLPINPEDRIKYGSKLPPPPPKSYL